MPKILKSKKQLKRSWHKTPKTFILKSHKVKKKKQKHTNFFKAFNWQLLKFDFVKFLGRTYYIRKFVLFCLLDLTLALVIIFSGFKLWLLVFAIPLGIGTLNSFVELILDSFYRHKNKAFNNSLSQVARVGFSSGPPGTGKTSSKVYEARHKAKQLWGKLQEAYFFALRLNKEKLSQEQLSDYNAVVDSYDFYINHPQNIPCLWSNIPIWDENGNMCFKLTKKHLMQ